MNQIIEGLDNEVSFIFFFITLLLAVVVPLYILRPARRTAPNQTTEAVPENNDNSSNSDSTGPTSNSANITQQENNIYPEIPCNTSENRPTDPQNETVHDDSNDMIQLRVIHHENSQQLSVSKNMQLKDLKQKCFPTEYAEGRTIRLIYSGRVLNGEAYPLRYLGVMNGSVLHSVISDQTQQGRSNQAATTSNDLDFRNGNLRNLKRSFLTQPHAKENHTMGNLGANKCVLNPLTVNLPNQLRIEPSSIPCQSLGVFTSAWIKKGTKMGPYTGKLFTPDVRNRFEDSSYMWEIFDRNGEVNHFIDGKDELDRNWMCYVQCARSDQEQNLEIVQHGNEKIFYYALKDIPPNQELLVWYGSNVDMFLGIPQHRLHFPSKLHQVLPEDWGHGEVSSIRTRLHCTVCRRGFNSRSNLRSHMRIHTLEKPFHCKYCKKSFSQSSTLRNHVRLHTGERPYSCSVCKMAYSQLAGLRAHQKSARHRPQGRTVSSP